MKNISKIISIAFLSFSILLLCYVFFRSQILYKGIRFDYYFNYFVIAFLFIIFSFISFIIPKKLKINIVIVFLSILIGLYLVEGYLTIKSIDNRFEIYKNNTGKDYDIRSLFEVYQDLKVEDTNIVVPVSPRDLLDNNFNYFSLSGIPNRKTIHCNENGYYTVYQSDRYGFNTPDKEWNKDKIDYLLVGDSFTHGSCVNEPDTISGNLRKLNNSENGILNLGQLGNGPLVEYATLREYLPFKKVKRVLWLYYENDLRDLRNELKNQILVNYLKDPSFSQNLISKKQKIKKILLKQLKRDMLMLEKMEKIKGRFVILNKFKTLIKFVRLDSVRGFTKFFKPSTKGFKNILKLSNEFTKQNDSKLYFVYIPDYYSTRYMNYNEVIQIVESLNIPIIDLKKELIKEHKDPLSLYPFRKRGHFNEKGYQLVAEKIFSKINELEK